MTTTQPDAIGAQQPAATAAPVSAGERIGSIDVLRGFALLGILIMNIQSFAMVSAAYLNPTAYGDLSGANLWVWILSHVFADQKFMTLFSLLFGTGVVIMWERAQAKGVPSTWLHYRRTFWLFGIGMAHAYLLWSGDVLVTYALCALWIYWLRKASPKKLTIVAGLLLLVSPALSLSAGLTMSSWPEAQVASMATQWAPPPDQVAAEVAAMQGGWVEQMEYRVPYTVGFQLTAIPFWAFWRASGVMLLGMALFKAGFLKAEWSRERYLRWLVVGITVGTSLSSVGVWLNFQDDWPTVAFFTGSLYNYVGSLFTGLAYAAGIMLLFQAKAFPALQRGFAAVGRMALTNYLLQTILCTTIFYGHGLGLFGEVDRVGQALVVLGVWAFQIPFSVWWLKHFRFGPFEWLWRSLTYMSLQPLRVASR